MARPSPVPPKVRVVEASAWVKRSNSCSTWASDTPTPVSFTDSDSQTCPSVPGSQDAVTVTPPSVVNFTALDSKFSRTCRNRPESPIRPAGRSGSISSLRSRPLARHWPSISSTPAWARASGSNRCGSSSTAPASSLE